MRLLDLFHGAGGAAEGYRRAGFEVVGVELNAKAAAHSPFEVIVADALEVLADRGFVDTFDAIHSSPPCQSFTRAKHLRDAQGGKVAALDLVAETRTLLRASGKVWVIENVPGAPVEGVTLCGSAFGLKVRRHRVFESNVLIPGVECRHKEQGRPVGVYHVLGDSIPQGGRTARTLEEAQEAMGIDWMPWNQLKESLPPAYCEHVGRWLLGHIDPERWCPWEYIGA